MKKNRKDVKGTTDNGRTIISKTGKEYPRCYTAHYPLYKISKDLSLDDISALISIRQDRFNSIEDKQEIKTTRSEIKMLQDQYRINRRQLYDNVEDGDYYKVVVDYNLGTDGNAYIRYNNDYVFQYFNEDESRLITSDAEGTVIDYFFSGEMQDSMGETEYELFTPIISSNKSLYKDWEYHKNVEL